MGVVVLDRPSRGGAVEVDSVSITARRRINLHVINFVVCNESVGHIGGFNARARATLGREIVGDVVNQVIRDGDHPALLVQDVHPFTTKARVGGASSHVEDRVSGDRDITTRAVHLNSVVVFLAYGQPVQGIITDHDCPTGICANARGDVAAANDEAVIDVKTADVVRRDSAR